MSLLNVHVTDDRALIAVDTDGVSPTGEHFEICKMYPLIHANVVLAGQGALLWHLEVFNHICRAAGQVDYDVIVDDMPELLRRMTAGAREHGALDLAFSLAIVGLSPREGRIAGRWYEGRLTGDKVEVHSLGSRVGPWPFDDPAPIPDSDENHRTLATRQTAFHRSLGFAGGGRLLLAELTRDALFIRSICNL